LCLSQSHAQPMIDKTVPADGAPGVPANTTFVFTFSEAINPLATTTFFLYDGATFVPTTPTWSAGNTVLTCTPLTSFPAGKMISWVVSGQSAGGEPVGGTGTFTTSSGGGSSGGTGTNAITSFTVSINHSYNQTSAAAPVIDSLTPYLFTAFTGLSSNRTATNVTLTLPTSMATNLTQNFLHPEDFMLLGFDTNLSTFNSSFPSGDYTFNVKAITSNQTVVVNFPSTLAQPDAPHLTNFAAFQAVDPTQPFTLGWDPFPGGTMADAITVRIDEVFNSGDPGSIGALNGIAKFIVIPAGTLQPATSHDGTLAFYHYVATTNGTSYVKLAYRGTATQFSLVTTEGAVTGPLMLTNAVFAPPDFTFDVLCSAGQTVTVEYRTNLSAGQWQVLLTTNSPGNLLHAVAPQPTSNRMIFFRARDGM
jgi:Bacterial Ig-like domain